MQASKWMIAFLVLGLSVTSQGQNVTITGKAVDPNGAPFYTGKAQLVSGNGSGAQSWTFGGTNPVNPTRPISGLDAYGNFAIDLMNTSLIDQQSAQPEWQFNFCSSGTPAPVVCFNVPAMALTSSQSITAQINAVPPPLIPGSSANINLASPPPIGNVTPNTGQFTTVNKVIDPLTYAGSDVGAQINAAVTANSCSATNPCNVVLPPTSQLSFSTTISIPGATTLSCTEAGVSVRQSTPYPPTLNYTGSGIAIQQTGDRAVFRGCSIACGNATTCILESGQNSRVEYVYTIGGAVGSKVVHLNNGDNMALNEFTSFESQGDVVYIDNTIDNQLTNVLVYGYSTGGEASNHTSRSLVLDSNANGVHVTNFGGGNSGLHGLVIQNTLGGNPPIQLFFTDFVSDCSYSDGVLFDSSIGATSVQAHFDQLWSAGAGDTCNGTSVRGLTAANGVHISGGLQIYINNGWLRANANNAVYIDSSNAGDVHIKNSLIQANNFANSNSTPNGSGVYLNAYIDTLEVANNQCGDKYEYYTAPYQNYCTYIAAGGAQNVMVHDNVANNNVVSPFSYPTIGSSGVMQFVNNTNQGGTPPDNIMYGQMGLYNPMAVKTGVWMLTSFATATNGWMGIGNNCHYDYVNTVFRCNADGANNGGSMLQGSSTGAGQLAVVSSTGPSTDQTFAIGSLSTYVKMLWDSSGNFTFGNNLTVNSILSAASLKIGGVQVVDGSQNANFANVKIGGTNSAPVVAAPTVGQAACIYAAGPPVQIGKCTSVVGAGGACTCAP